MTDFSKDTDIDALKAEIRGDTPTISSHLPDIVDSYISIRAQRLRMEKEVNALEESEKELYKTIVSKYREGGLSALGGKLGVVKMTDDIEPVVQGDDWPTVWEYIKETGDFSLLHKRITVTAVKERWDAGLEIPGVGRMTKYKLSVSGTK